MRRVSLLLIAAAWLAAASPAAAVTREDFLVPTTQDLIDVCTTPESDPLYAPAIAFCHGYLVGAYHYHVALHSGPDAKPVVCPPQPTPTRVQAVDQFVAWAKAHPQYADERPVEALVKFLTDTWPCGSGGKAK